MAISNSIDFTVTRDEIITQAYRQIGVLGEGETCNSEQLNETAPVLNMMLKTWQADGLNLFAVQRNYLFIVKEQEVYTLGLTTTDHFTSTFYQTTTSAAASSGATTITVTDASNISDGDYIGVVSGTDTHWTTVNGAPSGSTVTLTSALTADVAASSTVYNYTAKANRPMDVIEGFLHMESSETDIPVERISRREYSHMSQKGSTGVVTQMYYDPQLGSSKLYVWPTGNSEEDYLVLFVQKTLSDLDSSTNTAEYPQEWFLPMYLNLALLLAPRYGIPNDVYQKVNQQATYWYETAKGFDSEMNTSLFLTPDYRGME